MIGTKEGTEYARQNATNPELERRGEEGTRPERPDWNRIHNIMFDAGSRLGWPVSSSDNQVDLHQEQEEENESIQYIIKNWQGKEKQWRQKTDKATAVENSSAQWRNWAWDKQSERREFRFPAGYGAFTDGSKGSSGAAGAGAVSRRGGQHGETRIQATFGGPQTVPNAEAVACEMAVERAIQDNLRKLDVFIDASTIVFGLRKYRDAPMRMMSNPLRVTYKRISNMIDRSGIQVRFFKILSHTDIDGNEEADELANRARKEGQNAANAPIRNSGMETTEGVKIQHHDREWNPDTHEWDNKIQC